MNEKDAIVVTGIGVFSSIGCSRKSFWQSLVSGVSGVRKISTFNPDGHKSRIASEVQSFNPTDYIPLKHSRKIARVSQLASSAAVEAVKDAGLNLAIESPERVGCVKAHGTSTRMNDKVESISIKNVFKNRKGGIPAVSSNKSMIGHTLGVAGAIEAAATVLSVHHGVLTPTINFENNDPDCDIDIVENEARDHKLKAAISNSFGFGGQNAGLVFSKVN
jgi:3-oxoacyl-(acyl-carrier-protein) synthase